MADNNLQEIDYKDIDLQEIHDFLISLAHRAGELITTAHPTTGNAGSKKNSVDLVTETDQAVETIISTALHERYPTFAFMGEETYEHGDTVSTTPTFIVDPIDGTTNFVHKHPYISISLGLAINLIPVIGIVYNPITCTLYSAIKGHGAFMTQFPFSGGSTHSNTSPYALAQCQKFALPLCEPAPFDGGLSSCLVAIEWGSDRAGNDFDVKSKTFARLATTKECGGGMVHGLRSMGGAALNLCNVASGGIDVYWEAGCWAWDVCAGWVILEEAGGIMVDANPGNWNPKIEERRYMAVRAGEGQKGVVEEFWKLVEGRFEVGINNPGIGLCATKGYQEFAEDDRRE